MLSWLRRGPRFCDRDFASLALLISSAQEAGTPRSELLDPAQLDYSLESLRHLDAYLGAMHAAPPSERELMQVILRAGAYLGEVVRRLRPEFHWVLYEQAARYSENVRAMEDSIGTAGILWKDAANVAFPIGKAWKRVDLGAEDSVYTFGLVIANGTIERMRDVPRA